MTDHEIHLKAEEYVDLATARPDVPDFKAHLVNVLVLMLQEARDEGPVAS